MSYNTELNNPKNWGLIILVVILIVCILWGANFFLGYYDDRGTVGDMFGVVNSLFSGLAFGGIVLTIWMQREELRLQRDELEKTRNEFQTQNETLLRQRFESTFFNFLNLHNQFVNEIEIQQHTKQYKGKAFFKFTSETIHYYLKKANERNEVTLVEVKGFYFNEHERYIGVFGQYYRNFTCLLRMIDDISTNDKELEKTMKRVFSDLLKSQMSEFEVFLLAHHCLVFRDEELYLLVERYAMLQNFPKSLWINNIHRSFGNERAFGFV